MDERAARRVLEALAEALPDEGKGIGYEVNPNAAGVGASIAAPSHGGEAN